MVLLHLPSEVFFFFLVFFVLRVEKWFSYTSPKEGVCSGVVLRCFKGYISTFSGGVAGPLVFFSTGGAKDRVYTSNHRGRFVGKMKTGEENLGGSPKQKVDIPRHPKVPAAFWERFYVTKNLHPKHGTFGCPGKLAIAMKTPTDGPSKKLWDWAIKAA